MPHRSHSAHVAYLIDTNDTAEDESIEVAVEGDSNEDAGDIADDTETVAVENRDDEHAAEPEDPEPEEVEEDANRTRSGRISRPYDWAEKLPETEHYQKDDEDGRWIRPCHYDEIDMERKLSMGTRYSDSYFSTGAQEKTIETVKVDEPIEGWDDHDQFQLHHEALQ